VAWFRPSYSLYPVLASLSAARAVEIPLPRSLAGLPVPRPDAKLFFLTSPNSPYGFGFSTGWVARLLESFPGIVVADEAYCDFARENCLPLLQDCPRLIVVRSLSKAYSLAGMRIGLAFAHEELIAEMRKVKDSYNLSRLAQEAGRAALGDRGSLERTRSEVIAIRESFRGRLAEAGFTVLPSDANFLFAVPPGRPGARELAERLLSRGFLVRHFSAPELSDGLRISIGRGEDMDALFAAISEECSGG
jgi:histidinol-phosphate aminotransferase